MVQMSEAKFDPRFIEIMKQKTKLIDISRMCLYIDVLGKKQDKKSITTPSGEEEIDIDLQSVASGNSYDTYSNFTRKSRSMSQDYQVSVLEKDIKGI